MHKIGEIIKGTVTGIKQYGLFLKLDNESGFCHISNASNKFIKNLNDLFYIGQYINVKIIEITEQGKINVSIKDCQNNIDNTKEKNNSKVTKKNNTSVKENEKEKETFEEMLTNFMKISDDKISAMNKRKQKNKRR